MYLREITYIAVVVRIVAAFLLGGVLGLERGLKHRPAGLRTYMLVCVGSCIIMLINQYIFQVYQTGDPVRMGAQVVSGIGFLGAGTIIVTKRNQIKGLTTAAGLWASAAVGLAVGIGFYEAAIVGSILIFLTLTAVRGLDNHIHKKSQSFEIYAELDNTVSIGSFIRDIRNIGIEVDALQLDRDYSNENGIRSLLATIKLQKKSSGEDILEELRKIEGVIYLDRLS